MATIRKRGNSYQIRVFCGTDLYGKKVVNSMSWKPDDKMTERQIEKELNKIAVQFEEKVKNGIVTKIDNKIKLYEFCDIYLEMQKKALSPTTYHVYKSIITNYIVPALGHIKLAEVTPMHLQKFIYALSEKSISATSIKTYYAVVQSLFCFACKMGFLEYNPSVSTKLNFPKAAPTHTDILDENGIKKLLECLENEPIMWRVLIHLALCTGCRKGEIAALQWSDVIWKKNQINICKSLYNIKGEKGIKSPKNNTSNRIIAVPSYMIEMLKQYRNRQLEIKLSSEKEWNKHNMIFTDKKGDYISPYSISNWFKYFLQKNALSHIKFHALRHTSATILLASGTNIKTVSSRLGHSNLVTTNRYVHALIDADIAAAETLEQKLNFEKVGQEWDKQA
ncbi:tyrosine-type recombinase/integrase [Clostridium sp. MD294]|uniref:tyrosine-type recombinase/integrase n=1 Tax=Clostridium sp. MD294 TaxID=97138 RepID=UPI0002CA1791|nr:tyrosine-type recombinase/integrase [Clostridium sp. MD294]NDO45436.1 site-specific integrase [Clostridium sp. MD294]USF30919.1 Tyrosine recombinase XerC [Clostridium sp. MD294]